MIQRNCKGNSSLALIQLAMDFENYFQSLLTLYRETNPKFDTKNKDRYCVLSTIMSCKCYS